MSVRYEVRSAALTGLDAEVASLGGDLRTLLARVGMRPDALDDGEGLIRIEQLIHLLSEAAAQLQCPDLGLRVARKQLGWYMDRAGTAPDLRGRILRARTAAEVLDLLPEALDASCTPNTKDQDGDLAA